MKLNVDVFTTGQVGRLCCVSPRSVKSWCDNGKLKAYKLPPLNIPGHKGKGGHARRILRADLVAFMRQSGIPLGELADGSDEYRVILLGLPPRLANELDGRLTEFAGYRIQRANTAIHAGRLLSEFRPSALVIDLSICGRGAACEMAKEIREQKASHEMKMIALVGEDTPESGWNCFWDAGFDCVMLPVADAVVGELERLAAAYRERLTQGESR